MWSIFTAEVETLKKNLVDLKCKRCFFRLKMAAARHRLPRGGAPAYGEHPGRIFTRHDTGGDLSACVMLLAIILAQICVMVVLTYLYVCVWVCECVCWLLRCVDVIFQLAVCTSMSHVDRARRCSGGGDVGVLFHIYALSSLIMLTMWCVCVCVCVCLWQVASEHWFSTFFFSDVKKKSRVPPNSTSMVK